MALLAFWGASAVNELAAQAPGQPISVVSALFFSAGLPSFIILLVMIWFMKMPVKPTKKSRKRKRGGKKRMPYS